MKHLALLLALIASPCSAGDWSREDTYRQAAVTALLAADWAQTRWIARHPQPVDGRQHGESNVILGSHPTVGTVNNYFVASIVAHSAIAYMLPSDWRKGWQYVWIGIEAQVVKHNYSAGVKLDF